MAAHDTAPLYQSSFQVSDMVWLVDEYQRRSRSEPSLTLEGFAVEHGVSADELSSYVSDLSREINRTITLWHGTTMSRAQSILNEGFRGRKGKSQRGRTFFTTRLSMARGVAHTRASAGDPPAVLMCSIDLSRYGDYMRRGREVYVFEHDCIASEVVRRVERFPGQRHERPKKQEKHKDASNELTHVALTFGSGRAGIAYWINSYLKLSNPDRLSENHEAVEKIKQWLDEQVGAGRFGEVPEDEILEQLEE